MPTYSDPRFENMNRYMPGERPYVQVMDPELGKIHAQVIGWVPGEVFIDYPVRIIDYVTTGQHNVQWVPGSTVTRIRRADSMWVSTEDDDPWHERQDAKITYRADPWTAPHHETARGQAFELAPEGAVRISNTGDRER